MEKITVIVDGGRNITFTGERIGGASSRTQNSTRWYILRVYKTKGGKFVCERKGFSQWQGETDTYEGKVCTTDAEVIAYLGLSDTAKKVYDEAGIQHELEIE